MKGTNLERVARQLNNNMDYFSTVWNVGNARDLALLEGVQRRWTKNIDGMQDPSYGKRFKSLNVFSIKGRLLHSILLNTGRFFVLIRWGLI